MPGDIVPFVVDSEMIRIVIFPGGHCTFPADVTVSPRMLYYSLYVLPISLNTFFSTAIILFLYVKVKVKVAIYSQCGFKACPRLFTHDLHCGNRTPDPLIMAPTPEPLGHVLHVLCYIQEK